MKLVSYFARGRPGVGVVKGDGIVDLTTHFAVNDLKGLLARGCIGQVRELAASQEADLPLAEVTFAPVISNAGRFLCIGLNYEGHRLETGSLKSDHPQVFCRFNDTLTAHDDAIVRPLGNDALDYEGELAVIIGRTARRVDEGGALGVVAGYTCFNDASVRDWQKHTSQFTPGKNYPKTGALGPWMVTADEIADPGSLQLETRLNGKVVQRDSTANMLFSVRRVISYCSQFTQLSPGDVIATGTPSGVGYRRSPPVFMQPGDVVEVEIAGIGVLRNRVLDESTASLSS